MKYAFEESDIKPGVEVMVPCYGGPNKYRIVIMTCKASDQFGLLRLNQIDYVGTRKEVADYLTEQNARPA